MKICINLITFSLFQVKKCEVYRQIQLLAIICVYFSRSAYVMCIKCIFNPDKPDFPFLCVCFYSLTVWRASWMRKCQSCRAAKREGCSWRRMSNAFSLSSERWRTHWKNTPTAWAYVILCTAWLGFISALNDAGCSRPCRKTPRFLPDWRTSLRVFFFLPQSLADQETHLKLQLKELEANVLAAAPDKAKQKQMEKSLEAFKKGKNLCTLWREVLIIWCHYILPHVRLQLNLYMLN